MSSVRLVSSSQDIQQLNPDERVRSRWLLVNTVRLGFLLAILAAFFILQFKQPTFINIEVVLPIYVLLMVSFLLNGAMLVAYPKMSKTWIPYSIVSAYDAFSVAGLMYLTGANQSVFILLLLANIVLCGLLYKKTGAIFLAFWTSILYSLILIFGPEVEGQNIAMPALLNNVAFFTVAILSGVLSEQLSFLREEISVKTKDIETLQEFNQMIIDNISTGLITLDGNMGITQANPSAQRILGEEQLVGCDIDGFMPGVGVSIKGSLPVDRSTTGVNRFEINIPREENNTQILEVVVSPLYNSLGAFRGYVLMLQDLTVIKQMEFAMRQKEKLAAVGQLAAGIAHEIRNPLASISGSIQMLEGATESDEDRRLMAIVLKEIDRLNGLINEFLEYVRPEDRPNDPININDVINEVLESVKFNKNLRDDVEQKISLEAQRTIYGHRDKLKQAVLNIVVNAYQALDGRPEPQIFISTKEEQNSVVLKIADTGMGMTEEDCARIFEPFHTTKPGGTGLGLAITHKILEGHGARVSVQSELDQGTSFEIRFSAVNEPEPKEDAESMYA